MRVDPIDIVKKRKKLLTDLKRNVAIAIAFITLAFFFIKIVFL